MLTWDDFYIKLAELTAQKSKDRSTKSGCVIVGPDKEVRSLGFNGMPRGINDNIDERYKRPIKYKWFEHAERNAIYNAARIGTPLNGCSIYVNWFPCSDCARAIIQSGIKEVSFKLDEIPERDKRWKEDQDLARDMLQEAGIIIRPIKIMEELNE